MMRRSLLQFAVPSASLDKLLHVTKKGKKMRSSASNWKWADASHLFELQRAPFFGLSRNADFTPSQKVVASLEIDEHRLRNCQNIRNVVDVSKAMAAQGLSLDCKSGDEIKALAPADIVAYMKERDGRVQHIEKVEQDAEGFVWKLRRALRAESTLEWEEQQKVNPFKLKADREKNIDTLAWTIADLSGMNRLPLQITATGLDSKKDVARGHELKLFGTPLAAMGDVFVVRNVDQTRKPEKMVIVFEDKLQTELDNEGHLGQISAELLMMQYQNLVRFKEPAPVVYCVRIVNRYVSFFALTATTPQLRKVCLGTPKEASSLAFKLSLQHHNASPRSKGGLDLVNRKQRTEALRVLAAIRAEVLS